MASSYCNIHGLWESARKICTRVGTGRRTVHGQAAGKALQDQIKNEWYSAYLYLSMAAWFESANLEGFAHWMYKQAAEEQAHGKKMFDFLIDRGVKVVLQAIAQPPADFASPWRSSRRASSTSRRSRRSSTGLPTRRTR